MKEKFHNVECHLINVLYGLCTQYYIITFMINNGIMINTNLFFFFFFLDGSGIETMNTEYEQHEKV